MFIDEVMMSASFFLYFFSTRKLLISLATTSLDKLNYLNLTYIINNNGLVKLTLHVFKFKL